MKSSLSIKAVAAGAIGFALILIAALTDSRMIESAVGASAHSLSWGPGLFRALLAFHGIVLLVVALIPSRGTHENANVSSGNSSDTSPSVWLILSALTVVAFALRMWRLDTDLWFDELLTLLNYVRLPTGYIISRLPDQNNHILFSLMSRASTQIFGESAWAVRLPSVMFGVSSIWALFLLARHVLSSREALLASALMTVSYHHIWFSQNARGYIGLLFFSLLATWLWLEAFRRQGWWWWFGYSLAVVGGMWVHLTMVFVVVAHALVYLTVVLLALVRRSQKPSFSWRPFFALVIVTTMTLQFYALPLPEFLSTGMHEVSLESEWTNPWWVVTETLRNLRVGSFALLVALSGLAVLGLGWWQVFWRNWQSAVLMVLPGLLAGASMLSLGHNLWPRFFFFSMGFALLIAIRGAISLPDLVGKLLRQPRLQATGPAIGFVLASLLIVASAITLPRNYAHPKQDYTGARDFVESKRRPDDVVVAVGLAGVAYKSYFAPNWLVAQTESELEVFRRQSQNMWLIYTLPVEVKAYRPDVWRTIQADFSVVKVFPGTLGGGEIVVCRENENAPKGVAMRF